LGKGKNIALFDLDAGEPINGTLYETESVSYTFRQANNTYFVPKHFPDWARKHGVDPASPEAENPLFLRIVDFQPLAPNAEDPATERD
jgi:hypothetical protein